MVIMLNLLISIISDTYERVSSMELLAKNFERLHIIYKKDCINNNSKILKKITEKENNSYLFFCKPTMNENELFFNEESNQNKRLKNRVEKIERRICDLVF